MAKRFSILKKSNCKEVNEEAPEQFAAAAETEGKAKPKYFVSSKHVWAKFCLISKSWKLGKSKQEKMEDSSNFGEEENASSFIRPPQSLCTSSKEITNEIDVNPFTESSVSEIDINSACARSTIPSDEVSGFSRTLLRKMSLQKLMGMFASANRKRQELFKRRSKKKEFSLSKATTFIVGQADFKNESSSKTASLHSDGEEDIYDIKYEDIEPTTTVSTTNVSIKAELSVSQFNSTSVPTNTPKDETLPEQSNLEEAPKLGSDESVCVKLVSHDFNVCDTSSNLNVNVLERDAEGKDQDVTDTLSAMNMDMECDSDEDMYDSESESSSSISTSADLPANDPIAIDSNDVASLTGYVDNNVKVNENKPNGDTIPFQLNTIQNLYTSPVIPEDSDVVPIIEQKPHIEVTDFVTVKQECTENQKGYSIVEDDIKTMIKELLNESKTIKETIVSSGIEEDMEPLFTYDVSQDKNLSALYICKSICDDMVSKVTSGAYKTFNTPNRKNIFTSKELVNAAAVSDVSYVINIILEQTLGTWYDQKVEYSSDKNLVSVNYCLVKDGPKYDSKIYSAASKFWQTNKNSRIRGHFLKFPLVSVKNLSPTPKINMFKSDEKLINRVRKSAALLLALYEEMRDYSYHTTSRLFNDLYETISLLDKKEMPRHALEHPGANFLLRKRPASQVCIHKTNSNHENPKGEPATNPKPSPNEKNQDVNNDKSNNSSFAAGTSYTKQASINTDEILPTYSDSSLCSSEINEEVGESDILPNLRYTYVSDEEVNSSEEIKQIEKNAKENRSRNLSLQPVESDETSLETEMTDDDLTSSSGNEDVHDDDKSQSSEKQ